MLVWGFNHGIVWFGLFRRFTHSHLAQLKFILRKAIVLRKHLVLDERTSCMKPDIHISLDPDAVEADAAKLPPQGGRVSLKKVFRARLRDFCESHPEVGHKQFLLA